MKMLKRGDIVTRNSYQNDILFRIDDFIELDDNKKIAILKGVTLRIEATAYLFDLRKESKEEAEQIIKSLDRKIDSIIEETRNEERNLNLKNSLILHLDGDKKYALKSAKVYSKLGLNAIVKNIKENKQPYEIEYLLNKYNPDIVVLTGHDRLLKKGKNFYDLANYQNSKYFIETVKRIRRWENNYNYISIFAGACQSYYEAIIGAGANFASSPARILIDFMDPLIVAKAVAMTPETKYLTIKDIKDKLRDGQRGISGVGTYGKLK